MGKLVRFFLENIMKQIKLPKTDKKKLKNNPLYSPGHSQLTLWDVNRRP